MKKTENFIKWEKIIEDCESSELSNKNFCENNGHSIASYYTWRRKIRKFYQSEVIFTPVVFNHTEPLESSIELSIGKAKIIIKNNYDEKLLLKLITALNNA